MNATVDTVPSVEKTVPGLLPPLSRSGSASPFVATGRSILSALESLGASRVRTFLTMLGIIIGVGAVIIVIAIGQGASAQVNSQLAQLGTNMLTVQPGSANVGGVSTGTGGRPVLSNADVHAIEQLEHVAAISPVVGGQIQVTAGSANWNTRVIGVYPAYQAIATYPIAEGAFFDQTDEDSSGAVAVLGQTVVNTLFPGRDPVGQPVRIRNVIFHVVGVLAPKGSNGFQDQDDIILIPFSAAQLRLYGSTAVQQIQIQVDAPENMSTVMDDATAVLRQTHRLKTSQVNDFTIRNAQQFIATAQQATQTLTVLLTAVAAVSLVVGGIGIMNIMLVSISERTREIGIRLALGARGRDVLLQFLVEAVTLSLVGGAAGIILGAACSALIGGVTGWPMAVAPAAVGLAFGFAATVGIFFGFYPARRAAGLDPIEALRHE